MPNLVTNQPCTARGSGSTLPLTHVFTAALASCSFWLCVLTALLLLAACVLCCSYATVFESSMPIPHWTKPHCFPGMFSKLVAQWRQLQEQQSTNPTADIAELLHSCLHLHHQHLKSLLTHKDAAMEVCFGL